MSWSLDHAGPMGRTAEDVAYLLTPLAGYDAADPASARVPAEDYVAALRRGSGGLRMGLATNVLEMADENVRQATQAAAEVFRGLGVVVEPVTYPHRELAAALRVISSSEAYAYHATDLDELPRKYGRQLEHRTKAGGLYFASEYIQAQRVRTLIQQAVAELFQHIDLLLCPTMPTEPPTYEESLADTWMRRPGITNLFNLTGQPAVAFPTGFSSMPCRSRTDRRSAIRRGDRAARRPPLPGRDRLAQAPPRALGGRVERSRVCARLSRRECRYPDRTGRSCSCSIRASRGRGFCGAFSASGGTT